MAEGIAVGRGHVVAYRAVGADGIEAASLGAYPHRAARVFKKSVDAVGKTYGLTANATSSVEPRRLAVAIDGDVTVVTARPDAAVAPTEQRTRRLTGYGRQLAEVVVAKADQRQSTRRGKPEVALAVDVVFVVGVTLQATHSQPPGHSTVDNRCGVAADVRHGPACAVEHATAVGDYPLTPPVVTLHLAYIATADRVLPRSDRLHPLHVGRITVVYAQVKTTVLVGYPGVARRHGIHVAGLQRTAEAPLHQPADIGKPALTGVEQVESAIVGTHPDVVAAVGLDHGYAVGRQGVVGALLATPEGDELIAVVTAQPVPRSYPHQSAAVLLQARNEVGRHAVVYGECTHEVSV